MKEESDLRYKIYKLVQYMDTHKNNSQLWYKAFVMKFKLCKKLQKLLAGQPEAQAVTSTEF